MDSATKVLINLRVSPDERDELKAAGERATPRRLLPAEVLYRLRQYQSAKPGGVAEAIGDLAAVVTARSVNTLARLSPGGSVNDTDYRNRLLAAVRDGLTAVLDDLGAKNAADETWRSSFTWDVASYMVTPSPGDDATPEGRTLNRIGKALRVQPGEYDEE